MSRDDDIRTMEALGDPFGFFRRLRERDPVHWSESSRAWLLTGLAEVGDAFRDVERLSSDRVAPILPLARAD
jgi:cytochrome P450